MVEALEGYRYSEPRFATAALILQVAHSEPDINKCEEIASKFVELLVVDQKFDACGVAAALASKGKVKTKAVANFLLALSRHLAASDWVRRNTVMSGLDDIVRRRQSGLNQPEVQRALKIDFFPPRSSELRCD
jgi:hypothetical protein